MKQAIKTIPLLIIIGIMFCFFYFHLYQYLTVENIRAHRHLFLSWTRHHYLETVAIYMLAFIIAEATAIPGSTFFAIVGGFLFGTLIAAFYAVLCITTGGILFFLAVKMSLGDWLVSKSGKANNSIKKWEVGFQQNAFSYLLMLRLFPFIPFWTINAAAGILGVRLKTFAVATLIGITPGIILCTSIGHGLDSIFSYEQLTGYMWLFQSKLILPVVGLAFLSFLPLIYTWLKPRTKTAV